MRQKVSSIVISLSSQDLVLTAPDLFLTSVDRSPEERLVPYCQRDRYWSTRVMGKDEDGKTRTIGSAGCLLCAYASRLSCAGIQDTPPTVMEKLQKVGAMTGALINHPERIPEAYPSFQYEGGADWIAGAADLVAFRRELDKGPVPISVDFHAMTLEWDQHWVLALRLDEAQEDLVIMDPWDGAQTWLLRRYALSHWDLKRAIYGMRSLQVAGPRAIA